MLPVFSKVLEFALLTRLMSFLQRCDLLTNKQYGFRKHHSTIDAVRVLLDFVWVSMEGGGEAMAILCDLSKAFDTIQHNILLGKLEKYGIRGVPLQLMKSYLENRRQAVDGMSAFLPMECGVAQGSLIGPVFLSTTYLKI